jgi:DNA repair ATPase RecN
LISIAVGASKPTQFLRAGVAETRVVQPDSNFLVSVKAAEPNRLSAGPGGLWSFGDLSHALELIANPAAAKKRLDAIAQAMAEAQALIAQAHKQVASSAATVKSDQERMQKEAAEHAAAIVRAQRNFDEECERRANALRARETRLSEQESKLEADRAELQALHEDLSQRARAFEAATRPLSTSRKSV